MSEKYLTLLVVPHDERVVRRLRLSYRALQAAAIGAFAACILGVAALVAYGGTTRALRAELLQVENARLAEDNAKIRALEANLERTEANYRQIRTLAGLSVPPGSEAPGQAPLAPVGTVATTRLVAWAPKPSPRPVGDTAPSAWPLAIRGFVVQRFTGVDGHPGIDIQVPVGTPVLATASGAVKQTGYDRMLGHFVVLAHAGGSETLYAHNDLVRVERGDPVLRGEAIAVSGSSGRSPDPHLHYEVRQAGLPVDPAPYLP